jgi:hypothetical protein
MPYFFASAQERRDSVTVRTSEWYFDADTCYSTASFLSASVIWATVASS